MKSKGVWISIGQPQRREDAEEIVRRAKENLNQEQEFKTVQPHCVPL